MNLHLVPLSLRCGNVEPTTISSATTVTTTIAALTQTTTIRTSTQRTTIPFISQEKLFLKDSEQNSFIQKVSSTNNHNLQKHTTDTIDQSINY